jgi:hypothetical protein
MSYFPEFTSTTVLTSSQLLSLNSSPVLLAPGIPGTIVDIRSIYLEMNPGGSVYTVGALDSLCLLTGTITGGVPSTSSFLNYQLLLATGFVNSATAISTFLGQWWADSNAPLSVVEGQGIYAFQYSIASGFPLGSNWTGGNGTLKITINYSYIVA